jgi:hypothetical protein
MIPVAICIMSFFLIPRKISMIVRNLQDNITYYTEERTKKGLECGGRDAWTRNETAWKNRYKYKYTRSPIERGA